jgi:hypothetical protein
MKRREFITLLGGAALVAPLTARAQQAGGMRRVGVVMGYAATDPAAQAQVAALRQELQKLGWEEGRNIRIDVRFSGADAGRVRAAVMELMSFTPDVLVSNTNLVTAVVQAEVRTIPIVFIFVGDPVGYRLAQDAGQRRVLLDVRGHQQTDNLRRRQYRHRRPGLVRHHESREPTGGQQAHRFERIGVHADDGKLLGDLFGSHSATVRRNGRHAVKSIRFLGACRHHRMLAAPPLRNSHVRCLSRHRRCDCRPDFPALQV